MKFTFQQLNVGKNTIKKLYLALVSHAFGVMLLLMLLAILAGILLFYNYVVLAQTRQQEVSNRTVEFEYNKYHDILKAWEVKQQKFQEFNNNITNPFI